jgi:hypothetical protein
MPTREEIFVATSEELMSILRQLVCRTHKTDPVAIKTADRFFRAYQTLGMESGADGVAFIYTQLFENLKVYILFDTSTQWLFGENVGLTIGQCGLHIGPMCRQLAGTYLDQDRKQILLIDMLLSRIFGTIYGVKDEFAMLEKRNYEHEVALGLRADDETSIPGLQGMVGYMSDMIDSTLPSMEGSLPQQLVGGIRALQRNIGQKDLSKNPMQAVVDTVTETYESKEGQEAKKYMSDVISSRPVLAHVAQRAMQINSVDAGMDAVAEVASNPVLLNGLKETLSEFSSMVPKPADLSQEDQAAREAAMAAQFGDEDVPVIHR